MNEAESKQRTPGMAYVAAVLGAFLVVAALVGIMRHYSQAPQVDAKRVAERAKALAELRAADAERLNNTAWIDRSKGIVRLRIDDALEIVERDWGADPVAARSNLIVRVGKATAAPAAATNAPSPYE